MRTIAIAIFSGVQALDVAGPLDVFVEANNFVSPGNGYAITLVSATKDAVRASNGMRLLADVTFAEANGPYNTALVAGGPKLPIDAPDSQLIAWLINVASRCERFGSICTGAFALGHAGLINDRHVTTHWQNAPQLAQQFPRARVQLDRIYIRDGNLLTSAGVTAGIDGALALVAEDHGPKIALAVAKRLVVFAQRRGGQSQFSPFLVAPTDDTSPVAKVQIYVMEHIRERFTVEKLAEVAGMSTRHFARMFLQLTSVTPHEFVERARVDTARYFLESTDDALKAVAYDCGFGNADRMRIVFNKRLGVAPHAYRANFRKNSPD
ncbi:GlxA family transcriptional regulator [Glaciimonas sp. CA11.2]|uniref:GlxA family transcriptional regulator n=1 Tax=unclassified Glaciimonas TaxID=2644401 RepID=UPI002AB462E2|nr:MULTISPECIES: GlxA family transcriptional regulator [unclassified Glaciimonas]MDY7547526.1 GlxA family transcriptional regulator [Glaciimonas sp. CA11.2]MEB0013494.1 GlxA family transcriptional regulator [Glaciimonas sp. Cout2]MEB0081573.1 GlxA family transcriptional regulator [Glaciimonas sp. Gout2]MEB0163015.1 GlxA family transcriptional regulator [Glaciimonas sp. CA11.2]